MKTINFFILIVLLLGMINCKNDDSFPETNYVNAKGFLKEVKSDSSNEFFISGEFDGINIFCTSTFSELYPYHDTVYNAYYFNSSGFDQITLLRENYERSVEIEIYFLQSDIFNRQLPYKMPHDNLATGEYVQISLLNKKKLGTAVQNSTEDDFTFSGYSFTTMKIEVTSIMNNILEGTFEGSLITRSGYDRIIVKNGKFRTKIKVVELGI